MVAETSSIRGFTMRMSTIKYAMAASAAAAVVALAPAAPAAAAPIIACPIGSICVASGTAVLRVPEGQSVSFPGGLTMTAISNQTRLTYCVTGNPSFGIAPFQQIVRTQTINALAPSRGACLLA
jgi:hypothetical protein